MKRNIIKYYIIVSYVDDEITTPDLYYNKEEAYAIYARTLLEDLNDITYGTDDEISDEEFDRISDIIDNEDAATIKDTIDELMTKHMKNHDIYKMENGYAFGNNEYILEIFEVEAK